MPRRRGVSIASSQAVARWPREAVKAVGAAPEVVARDNIIGEAAVDEPLALPHRAVLSLMLLFLLVRLQLLLLCRLLLLVPLLLLLLLPVLLPLLRARLRQTRALPEQPMRGMRSAAPVQQNVDACRLAVLAPELQGHINVSKDGTRL